MHHVTYKRSYPLPINRTDLKVSFTNKSAVNNPEQRLVSQKTCPLHGDKVTLTTTVFPLVVIGAPELDVHMLVFGRADLLPNGHRRAIEIGA